MYIVTDEVRKDAKLLGAYIKDHKIEIATLPPSYVQLMDIEELKELKILITAGEAPVLDKVASFLQYGTFYNAYGPTEASICSTVWKGVAGSEPNIGRPIANTAAYILDDFGRLAPQGVVGELGVSGVCLLYTPPSPRDA